MGIFWTFVYRKAVAYLTRLQARISKQRRVHRSSSYPLVTSTCSPFLTTFECVPSSQRSLKIAMARGTVSALFARTSWICRQCRGRQPVQKRSVSTIAKTEAQTTPASQGSDIMEQNALQPARIIPVSASYFTGSPVFNDNLLRLQDLLAKNERLPMIPPDQVPRISFLRLEQYRSSSGESIAVSKYAQILRILARLNRISPVYRSKAVEQALQEFRRSGSTKVREMHFGSLDKTGRSAGVGRRKESVAKVYLVEGTGEILVNGKSIVHVFPRLHDRESAMWPLKVSQRLDKYNVFAIADGGGVTGQAEAITLGLAKALLVHEPALKPLLRRGNRSAFVARLGS